MSYKGCIIDPNIVKRATIDSLYTDAMIALEALSSVNKRFEQYRIKFSQLQHGTTTCNIDPWSTNERRQFEDSLCTFFYCLGDDWLSPNGIKIIQWLMKAYDIHISNTLDLIVLALPMYDNHLFVRMCKALELKSTDSAVGWGLTVQQSGTPLSIGGLVKSLSSSQSAGLIIIKRLICHCSNLHSSRSYRILLQQLVSQIVRSDSTRLLNREHFLDSFTRTLIQCLESNRSLKRIAMGCFDEAFPKVTFKSEIIESYVRVASADFKDDQLVTVLESIASTQLSTKRDGMGIFALSDNQVVSGIINSTHFMSALLARINVTALHELAPKIALVRLLTQSLLSHEMELETLFHFVDHLDRYQSQFVSLLLSVCLDVLTTQNYDVQDRYVHSEIRQFVEFTYAKHAYSTLTFIASTENGHRLLQLAIDTSDSSVSDFLSKFLTDISMNKEITGFMLNIHREIFNMLDSGMSDSITAPYVRMFIANIPRYSPNTIIEVLSAQRFIKFISSQDNDMSCNIIEQVFAYINLDDHVCKEVASCNFDFSKANAGSWTRLFAILNKNYSTPSALHASLLQALPLSTERSLVTQANFLLVSRECICIPLILASKTIIGTESELTAVAVKYAGTYAGLIIAHTLADHFAEQARLRLEALEQLALLTEKSITNSRLRNDQIAALAISTSRPRLLRVILKNCELPPEVSELVQINMKYNNIHDITPRFSKTIILNNTEALSLVLHEGVIDIFAIKDVSKLQRVVPFDEAMVIRLAEHLLACSHSEACPCGTHALKLRSFSVSTQFQLLNEHFTLLSNLVTKLPFLTTAVQVMSALTLNLDSDTAGKLNPNVITSFFKLIANHYGDFDLNIWVGTAGLYLWRCISKSFAKAAFKTRAKLITQAQLLTLRCVMHEIEAFGNTNVVLSDIPLLCPRVEDQDMHVVFDYYNAILNSPIAVEYLKKPKIDEDLEVCLNYCLINPASVNSVWSFLYRMNSYGKVDNVDDAVNQVISVVTQSSNFFSTNSLRNLMKYGCILLETISPGNSKWRLLVKFSVVSNLPQFYTPDPSQPAYIACVDRLLSRMIQFYNTIDPTEMLSHVALYYFLYYFSYAKSLTDMDIEDVIFEIPAGQEMIGLDDLNALFLQKAYKKNTISIASLCTTALTIPEHDPSITPYMRALALGFLGELVHLLQLAFTMRNRMVHTAATSAYGIRLFISRSSILYDLDSLSTHPDISVLVQGIYTKYSSKYYALNSDLYAAVDNFFCFLISVWTTASEMFHEVLATRVYNSVLSHSLELVGAKMLQDATDYVYPVKNISSGLRQSFERLGHKTSAEIFTSFHSEIRKSFKSAETDTNALNAITVLMCVNCSFAPIFMGPLIESLLEECSNQQGLRTLIILSMAFDKFLFIPYAHKYIMKFNEIAAPLFDKQSSANWELFFGFMMSASACLLEADLPAETIEFAANYLVNNDSLASIYELQFNEKASDPVATWEAFSDLFDSNTDHEKREVRIRRQLARRLLAASTGKEGSRTDGLGYGASNEVKFKIGEVFVYTYRTLCHKSKLQPFLVFFSKIMKGKLSDVSAGGSVSNELIHSICGLAFAIKNSDPDSVDQLQGSYSAIAIHLTTILSTYYEARLADGIDYRQVYSGDIVGTHLKYVNDDLHLGDTETDLKASFNINTSELVKLSPTALNYGIFEAALCYYTTALVSQLYPHRLTMFLNNLINSSRNDRYCMLGEFINGEAPFKPSDIAAARICMLIYGHVARKYSIVGIGSTIKNVEEDMVSILSQVHANFGSCVETARGSGKSRKSSGQKTLNTEHFYWWYELCIPTLKALGYAFCAVSDSQSIDEGLELETLQINSKLMTSITDIFDFFVILPRYPCLSSYVGVYDVVDSVQLRATKALTLVLRFLIHNIFERFQNDTGILCFAHSKIIEKITDLENANVHLVTIKILQSCWSSLSHVMMPCLDETLKFCIELLDSEDPEVNSATRAWILTMQKCTGESFAGKFKF